MTADRATDPGLFPRTEGFQVRIRPATAASGPDCYRLALGLATSAVSDEGLFLATLNRTFAGFFAVTRKDDGQVAGYTALADADPAGHMRLMSWMEPGSGPAGTEAAALTINYAFAMWPVRKVYLHVTDADPAYLRPLLKTVGQLEATLTDYEFFRGQAWDVQIFAVYRADWLRHGGQLAERPAVHDETLW